MPVPKPLPRNASKKAKRTRRAAVFHDLKHGKHHADRTRAQEIAIALKSSGEDRAPRRRSKKAARRMTSRSTHRSARR